VRRLLDFFSRARRRILDDPSNGIEYNELQTNRRVSRRIWSIDIARNPNVVKNIRSDMFIDVNDKIRKVNDKRDQIDGLSHRAKGR
jgi:hypothetical protein